MTEDQLILRDKGDLEWVMSTEQGRRFVWRILSNCNVFHDIEGEGTHVFRQIGRRQAGLYLLDLVTRDFPELYFKMQAEQYAKVTEERIKHEHANNGNEASGIDDLIGGGLDYNDPYGKQTFLGNSGHVAGL